MYFFDLPASPIIEETASVKGGISIDFKFQYIPVKEDDDFSDSNLNNFWTFGFKYKTFERKGLLLSNSPNLIDPYTNIMPVFLACYSREGGELISPCFLSAFSTGAYILVAGHLDEYDDFLKQIGL